MAKMFYSLEEAAQKLGKSEDQVKDLVAKGQLQEFRDRDKLMFKREQVDLIAGGDEDVIPLAGESGEGMGLAGSSGTGMSLAEERKDSTGINIFDAEHTEEADPSAVTRVSNTPGMVDPGDKSASGSGGLLDLTKEADDTSLGAGLLEDVYGSETVAAQTAAEPAIQDGGGGALFETPGDAAETAGAPVLVAAEPYDGAGSGLVGGLAVAMIVAIAIAGFTLLMSLTTSAGSGLVEGVGNNFMIVVGIMIGVLVIGGGLGFFLGKRS